MMRTPRPRLRSAAFAALVTLVSFGSTACGSDDPASSVVLSSEGELGQQIAQRSGCAGCHGANGQGQVGPPFIGLYGSNVTFDDGTTAVADDAYIRQAIQEPSAKRVEGYKLTMPENNLTDEQIEQVIAYIRDLSATATASPAVTTGDP